MLQQSTRLTNGEAQMRIVEWSVEDGGMISLMPKSMRQLLYWNFGVNCRKLD